MAVNVAITFDPVQEEADGAGWVLAVYTDESDTPTITTHATYTAAALAQKGVFQVDPDVTAYFQQKAEDQVLATNAAAVTSTRTSLRTAEGL